MTATRRCLLAVALVLVAVVIPWPIMWTPTDLQLYGIGYITFLAAVVMVAVAADTKWGRR